MFIYIVIYSYMKTYICQKSDGNGRKYITYYDMEAVSKDNNSEVIITVYYSINRVLL